MLLWGKMGVGTWAAMSRQVLASRSTQERPSVPFWPPGGALIEVPERLLLVVTDCEADRGAGEIDFDCDLIAWVAKVIVMWLRSWFDQIGVQGGLNGLEYYVLR